MYYVTNSQNRDWFNINLDEDGIYIITDQYPNSYRIRGIDSMSKF
jgi:hypothetical protein